MLAAQIRLLTGTFPSGQDTFSVGGAPSPGTSAVEVPVSTSTAITGGGVPSPGPVSLPPGTTQQTCEQFQAVCISSESTAAPFEFTVTLTCLPGNSAQVGALQLVVPTALAAPAALLPHHAAQSVIQCMF